MNPYIPEKVKVLDKWEEAAGIVTLRLDFRADHLPGQFMEVGIPGFGEAPVSICSFSKDFVELCIRQVGNTTRKLASLKKGDYAFVRGPFGNGYKQQDFIGSDIIMIGGGTGVAPLRSFIQYVLPRKNRFMSVSAFLGFRSTDDILFKRDIKLWKKELGLCIAVDSAKSGWKGSKGPITIPLSKAALNKSAKAVLCGPPVMIKLAIGTLLKKGIKPENIYTSYERLMQCGVGKCGHCMVSGKYTCKDGPVFRYDQARVMVE